MILKLRISSQFLILVVMLILSFILTSLATIRHALAETAAGNTMQSSSAASSAIFNLTTAAVVTFVLVLLGLAAALLLIAKYASAEIIS